MTTSVARTREDWSGAFHSFGDLHEQVLAGLVDLRGPTESTSISPRLLWGPPPPVWPAETLRELAAAGVLARPEASAEAMTAEFARAVEVIRCPRTNVNLRAWSPTHRLETNVQFPRNVPDGGGVALTPVARACRVVGFVEADDLWRIARTTFWDHARGAESTGFEAHLTAPQAGAMFALADLARAEGLQRLAGGAPPQISRYPAERVIGFAREKWGVSGLDQLLTAATVASGVMAAPAERELKAALDQLANAGILEYGDETYAPGPELAALVQQAMILAHGLQWQRVSLVAGGELAVASRILLTGAKGLLLAFDRSLDSKVLIRGVGYDEAVGFLTAELTTSLSLLPSPPAVLRWLGSPSGTCRQCGGPLPQGARFCPGCGSPA